MDRLLEGISLFNNADFFAAHDVFEDIWIEADQKDRYFYQGLTQASVGMFHMISGNLRGAKSQLSKSSAKLSQYPVNYLSIDLGSLISDIRVCLLAIGDTGDKISGNQIINIIPKIKLLK